MRGIPALLLAAAATAVSTGCATIAHGPRQNVLVTAEPSGAQVTVLSGSPDGPQTLRSKPGVTPIKLSLARRDPNIVLRLEKAGCPPSELRLKRSVSGWTAANLVFANPYAAQGLDSASDYPQMALQGLAVGFGIDFVSGGAFKLPNSAHAVLGPPGSPCMPVVR
jgi:hypothetical protein